MKDPKETGLVNAATGAKVEDITTYPTRAEIANRLGVSVTSVKRYERAGKLHGLVDAEGTHRFVPAEVDALETWRRSYQAATLDRSDPSEVAFAESWGPEERQNATTLTDLKMAGRMLGLLATPRESLDRMLLRTIERQAERIEELEAKYTEAVEAREAARDRQHERDIAAKVVERESKVQTEALLRIIAKAEHLIAPGTPFLDSLTSDQLEQLSLVRADLGLTEGQTRAVLEAHRRKQVATEVAKDAPKKGQH